MKLVSSDHQRLATSPPGLVFDRLSPLRKQQQFRRTERHINQNVEACGREQSVGNTVERRGLLLGICGLGLAQGPALADENKEQDGSLKKYIAKTLSAPRKILRERLRAQKGAKILAPIRASRERLLEAEKIIGTVNIYDPNPAAYKQMLQLIRAASMNCYSFEAFGDESIESRASLIQRRIGLSDACTYRLIAKNVTILLTQSQAQLKLDTYKILDDLINSYHLLDDMVDRAMDQDPMAIERVPDALQFTVANVSAFESAIERCLDLPVSNLATMPGKINEDGSPKEEEMKSDSGT